MVDLSWSIQVPTADRHYGQAELGAWGCSSPIFQSSGERRFHDPGKQKKEATETRALQRVISGGWLESFDEGQAKTCGLADLLVVRELVFQAYTILLG